MEKLRKTPRLPLSVFVIVCLLCLPAAYASADNNTNATPHSTWPAIIKSRFESLSVAVTDAKPVAYGATMADDQQYARWKLGTNNRGSGAKDTLAVAVTGEFDLGFLSVIGFLVVVAGILMVLYGSRKYKT